MASEGGEREGSEQRGDRSERWTSSRLLPGGQGSDCCSVSGPLSSGQGKCVCVYSCVCALAQSLMTGERFIAPPPPPPEWPMPFHSRPWFISANVLLEEHHCPLSADWAGLTWTQLYRASLGCTGLPRELPERQHSPHQTRSKGRVRVTHMSFNLEMAAFWCIINKV